MEGLSDRLAGRGGDGDVAEVTREACEAAFEEDVCLRGEGGGRVLQEGEGWGMCRGVFYGLCGWVYGLRGWGEHKKERGRGKGENEPHPTSSLRAATLP